MTDDSLILRLTYSGERQKNFSILSGDYNPIHDNPIYARRTLVGAQVVHGIHHLLAGMEALLEHLAREGEVPQGLSSFSGQFLKPVLVGDTVDFYSAKLRPDEFRITGKIEGAIMCQLSFQFAETTPPDDENFSAPPREEARELTFRDLDGRRGGLPLSLDNSLAVKLFPAVTKTLGTLGLAEILALTRLVGMECPGLHSLFSEATAAWNGKGAPGLLTYEVDQTDERFGRVLIQVQGPRLKGRLTTFFRPPPKQQPAIAAVARVIKANEFASSVALVIGGSRGLGEITAKIIAAGGGHPIVTYHQGAADAERLAREIQSHGGKCEVLQFDVREGESILREQFNRETKLTTLYYFATPKIGLRRGFFSTNLLNTYQEYYVTAFGRLLDAAVQTETKLRIFYPSTVFVDENPREMAEYVIAKRAAEDVCAFYNRYCKNIEIIVERLPRIKTDQTSSLMPIEAAEGLDVMLPIVRRMEIAE